MTSGPVEFTFAEEPPDTPPSASRRRRRGGCGGCLVALAIAFGSVWVCASLAMYVWVQVDGLDSADGKLFFSGSQGTPSTSEVVAWLENGRTRGCAGPRVIDANSDDQIRCGPAVVDVDHFPTAATQRLDSDAVLDAHADWVILDAGKTRIVLKEFAPSTEARLANRLAGLCGCGADRS